MLHNIFIQLCKVMAAACTVVNLVSVQLYFLEVGVGNCDDVTDIKVGGVCQIVDRQSHVCPRAVYQGTGTVTTKKTARNREIIL